MLEVVVVVVVVELVVVVVMLIVVVEVLVEVLVEVVEDVVVLEEVLEEVLDVVLLVLVRVGSTTTPPCQLPHTTGTVLVVIIDDDDVVDVVIEDDDCQFDQDPYELELGVADDCQLDHVAEKVGVPDETHCVHVATEGVDIEPGTFDQVAGFSQVAEVVDDHCWYGMVLELVIHDSQAELVESQGQTYFVFWTVVVTVTSGSCQFPHACARAPLSGITVNKKRVDTILIDG